MYFANRCSSRSSGVFGGKGPEEFELEVLDAGVASGEPVFAPLLLPVVALEGKEGLLSGLEGFGDPDVELGSEVFVDDTIALVLLCDDGAEMFRSGGAFARPLFGVERFEPLSLSPEEELIECVFGASLLWDLITLRLPFEDDPDPDEGVAEDSLFPFDSFVGVAFSESECEVLFPGSLDIE